MASLVPTTVQPAELQQAKQDKNYAFNWDLCMGKTRFPEGIGGNDQLDTCRNAAQWAYEKGDFAFLKNMCEGFPHSNWRGGYAENGGREACKRAQGGGAVNEVVSGACDGVGAKVDALVKAEKITLREDFKTIGKKLLDCGDVKTLFGSLVSLTDASDTNSAGFHLLVDLQAAGADVAGALHKYLALPKPVLRSNLGRWLVVTKNAAMCRPMADALTANGDVTYTNALLFYFTELQCKEGVALALSVLHSTDPGQRQTACVNLATLGGKKDVAKLKPVADGDAYAVRGSDGAQVYPVRAACAGAIARMQSRE